MVSFKLSEDVPWPFPELYWRFVSLLFMIVHVLPSDLVLKGMLVH